MNGAVRAELRAGRPVFPVLEVAWTAKGYLISTERYGRGAAIMLEGPAVQGVVPTAGFAECRYGPGMKGNTLVAARTSVKVSDGDGRLRAMLETYDPHGSPATIRWASPHLVASDWEPIFTGLVEDWKIQGVSVEILLKTNDAALLAPGPKPMFSRSEWASAYEQTIWGTAMPVVTGIHDSYKVTGRGMVPAVNVKWNEDLGQFWWCASVGSLKSIPRIYYDGGVKETGFNVVRGFYGGVYQTMITVDKDNIPKDSDGKPEGGQVVSFDCQGPDIDGLSVGDPVTNPITQLRAILNNYLLADHRGLGWLGDNVLIDTTSWDAVEAYFDLYGYEGAVRLGGGEREPGLKVFESVLKAHPWMKAWWTPVGKIALGVIPHADPSVTADDLLNATTLVSEKEFKFEPGDRKEILSGIISPYLYSHAEGKFLGSYEAHDLCALPREEWITDEIENPFSQGRYDQT